MVAAARARSPHLAVRAVLRAGLRDAAGRQRVCGRDSVSRQSVTRPALAGGGRRAAVVPGRRAAGARYSSAAHAAHGEPLDSESLSRALP